MPESRLLVLIALLAAMVTSTTFARKPTPPLAIPVTQDLTKTSAASTFTNLRPLVWNVAPGEDFGFALHWSQRLQPLAMNQYAEHKIIRTLESMTIHITDGNKKTHQLQATVTDNRVKWRKHPWSLPRSATLFIAFNEKGFTEATGITGKWKNAAGINLSKEGVYRVQVSGTVHARPMTKAEGFDKTLNFTFKTGTTFFHVGKSINPMAQIRTTAKSAITKHLPKVKLSKEGYTESGYTQHMVFADQGGNRVFHLAGSLTGGFKWGYDLIRVIVSPKGQVIQVAHRGVDTCIAEGTMIETPDGPKAIENLHEGDKVFGIERQQSAEGVIACPPLPPRIVPVTIQTIRRGFARKILVINDSLRLTHNHPVLANDEWIPAGRLTRDHSLMQSNGKIASIRSIRVGETPTRVYDLTVDRTHNFIAGGFVVHNKDRAWHYSLDDPWYFYWPVNQHKWTVIK